MSVLMLIHSVQTSLYVFAACLYLNMKCADCRLKPCLPCQVVQREGRVLPLPSTWPRGSDTHPAQAGLGSTWGQEASCSAFHVVWEGISQREGPARVPLATDANQGKGSFGENCCRAPPAPNGNTVGDPPPKVQGQFGYGMENLLAKAAVPALLSCLWPGSFASSLGVPSEWSPWLLPTSLTSGNREHLCAQGHCQVKSFGKGSGVHSLLCKMTAEG